MKIYKPNLARYPVVWLMALVVVGLTTTLGSSPSWAQANDATRILKAMSDFIAKENSVAIAFDADIEVINSDLQKIQFTNSGTIAMSRPDKLRATRTGGYSDVELVFDGKVATVVSNDDKVYTRLDAPGTIDQLIGRLRSEYSITAPGSDLLLANVFDELTEDVIDAKNIGLGVIDGVECQHLAFRTPEVDWQIWIEIGNRPIPRKYVITSKAVAAAPQYTLRIKEWKSDVVMTADSFTFKPATGMKEVAAADFPRKDEVPDGEGTVVGGLK